MLFRVDDDLFGDGDNHPPTPAARGELPDKPEIGEPFVLAPHGPAFDLAGEAHAAGDDDQPVVDRDDEIPDRFWAPEIAGLGRRAAALLVDQAILALLLESSTARHFWRFGPAVSTRTTSSRQPGCGLHCCPSRCSRSC
jgi:hypothetical protein